jgi:hypothetical protein
MNYIIAMQFTLYFITHTSYLKKSKHSLQNTCCCFIMHELFIFEGGKKREERTQLFVAIDCCLISGFNTVGKYFKENIFQKDALIQSKNF